MYFMGYDVGRADVEKFCMLNFLWLESIDMPRCTNCDQLKKFKKP